MKRLIEMAKKETCDYLTQIGIEHNGTFDCMGTTISFKDVPDDLDLTGYEVTVTNVLYPNDKSIPCCLTIKYGTNRIMIELPMWLKLALFSATTQGQNNCIELLTKLNYEHGLIHKGTRIPYDNTVA